MTDENASQNKYHDRVIKQQVRQENFRIQVCNLNSTPLQRKMNNELIGILTSQKSNNHFYYAGANYKQQKKDTASTKPKRNQSQSLCNIKDKSQKALIKYSPCLETRSTLTSIINPDQFFITNQFEEKNIKQKLKTDKQYFPVIESSPSLIHNNNYITTNEFRLNLDGIPLSRFNQIINYKQKCSNKQFTLEEKQALTDQILKTKSMIRQNQQAIHPSLKAGRTTNAVTNNAMYKFKSKHYSKLLNEYNEHKYDGALIANIGIFAKQNQEQNQFIDDSTCEILSVIKQSILEQEKVKQNVLSAMNQNLQKKHTLRQSIIKMNQPPPIQNKGKILVSEEQSLLKIPNVINNKQCEDPIILPNQHQSCINIKEKCKEETKMELTISRRTMQTWRFENENVIEGKGKFVFMGQEEQYNNALERRKFRALVFDQEARIYNTQKVKYKSSVRKQTKQQIVNNLIKLLTHLHELNLNLKENVFSVTPYQKSGSMQLIQAAKMNKLSQAEHILRENKYLVYDFDYVFMTALHWACKNGHLLMVKLLIEFGADVNAKDLAGRTPLYLASAILNEDIVRVLLYFRAYPWSTKKVSYQDFLTIKSNSNLKAQFSQARRIYITLRMLPAKLRETKWMKERNKLLYDDKHEPLNYLIELVENKISKLTC